MARSLITWQIMTNAGSTHHNHYSRGKQTWDTHRGTLLASSSGIHPVTRVSQLSHPITSKYCAQLLLWLDEKVYLLWCLEDYPIKCACSSYIGILAFLLFASSVETFHWTETPGVWHVSCSPSVGCPWPGQSWVQVQHLMIRMTSRLPAPAHCLTDHYDPIRRPVIAF